MFVSNVLHMMRRRINNVNGLRLNAVDASGIFRKTLNKWHLFSLNAYEKPWKLCHNWKFRILWIIFGTNMELWGQYQSWLQESEWFRIFGGIWVFAWATNFRLIRLQIHSILSELANKQNTAFSIGPFGVRKSIAGS